ncbi:MAG: hypothetical protein DMF50_00560, partial [Acidobacteria bacterium]
MSSQSNKKRRAAVPLPGTTRGTGGPTGPAAPSGEGARPARRWRSAAVVVLAAGIAILGARLGTVRVAQGERIFRRAFGGAAVRLAPGRHLALPFVYAIERLPAGGVRVEGSLPVRSREGVSLEVPFEVTGEIGDAAFAALPLRDRAGQDGPAESLIRSLASERIRGWGEGASGETLILGIGARAIESEVRVRLEERGFESVVVRLDRARGPAELIASITSRALRERTVATGAKIAILGLDGADWQILDPLLEKGQLPNLARLKSRGAWGNLKSMYPMLSPLLWTSIATGEPPEKHGIIDFLAKDAQTGRSVPVTSRWRKVKALWNIFTDAGRSSAFVAWWATYPAEPVLGHMVSDWVAYSLFGLDPTSAGGTGMTYPPGYFEEIRPKIVDDGSIPLAEIQRFVRVSPAEFAGFREKIREDSKGAYRLPVNHLTKILASARSYQAIGLDILTRGQPDLFSIYYEGIDEVCHRFAHYMPPKMGMVSPEEYGKYSDAVFAYYRYQDRLLGQVLARLAPDTTVMVLSDHGFRNGSDRPPNDPPYIEGKPGLWHRRYGILILAGPPIRPGRLDTTALLDIAPTALYLAGLPVAEDMPGRVVLEAIDVRFKARFPPRSIPSYEGSGQSAEPGRDLLAESGANAEMMEKLHSLGYIGDPAAPAGGPAAPEAASPAAGGGEEQKLLTGHLNEAGILIKNKEYDKAEEAISRALKIDPHYTPALLLTVQINAEQKRYAPAIETARQVIEAGPEAEPGLYLQLGRIYAESGRTDEGLAYLGRLEGDHPQMAEIHSALGTIRLKRQESDAAEKELLEALRLNPALGDPLTELHKIYQGTERVLSLEPLVRKGLAINEKSVIHHNWMGFIHEWKKELPQAEAEFHRAV